MKKSKMIVLKKIHFFVYDPIFERKIHVFLNHTYEDFLIWLHGKHYKCSNDETKFNKSMIAYSVEIGNNHNLSEYAIGTKTFNWTIGEQASLIHEIIHSVVRIWDTSNQKCTLETQEFFAISVHRIFEDICHNILKTNRKNR